MIGILRKNPRAAIFAAVIHVVFLVLLVLSFQFESERPKLPGPKQEEIVQAVAVDEKLVEQELKKLKAAETRKQRKLDAQVRKAENAKKQAQKARKQEELRLKEAKRKAAENQKVESQRLEKLAEQRKQEEQRLKEIESQRKQEELRLAEADRQRREEELRRKMEVEQKRLAQEQNAKRQTLLTKYQALIEAKVRRHWRVPPGAVLGTECELRVRLIPSGDVMQVQITRSSGNPVFDRSVENAVRKASPLPVPAVESGLFEEFRDLRFPFKLEKS